MIHAMNRKASLIRSALILGIVVGPLTTGISSEAAETDTNPVEPRTERNPLLADFQPPASVFHDEPGAGIDPFFPGSSRRQPLVEEVGPDAEMALPRVDERVLAGLQLKGISGTRKRKIALINSRTFEEGEIAAVNVEAESTRIRCEKIRQTSVIISLLDRGLRKELFLNP